MAFSYAVHLKNLDNANYSVNFIAMTSTLLHALAVRDRGRDATCQKINRRGSTLKLLIILKMSGICLNCETVLHGPIPFLLSYGEAGQFRSILEPQKARQTSETGHGSSKAQRWTSCETGFSLVLALLTDTSQPRFTTNRAVVGTPRYSKQSELVAL